VSRSLESFGDYASPKTDREDLFDFVQTVESLVNAIRLNTNLVLVVTAIVIVLAGLYHYVWPPIYAVEAVITVERTDDPQRDAFYREWNLFRKEDARTEIELMKSGSVLKAVIEKEGLRYDDVYHPFMSQISHFWNESLPGRAYKATKDWIFGVAPSGLTKEQEELGKTIKDMQAGFSVQTSGDVLVGTVRAVGPTPRIAAITNTWVDEYLNWRREQHLSEARRSIEALGQEIERAEEELQALSQQRVEFLNANNLIFDFSKETQQVEELVKLETELAKSRTRIAVLTASLQEIERQLELQPQTRIVSSVTDLNQLRETAEIRRLELEATLIRDQQRFRDDAPEIVRLKSQIQELTDLIEASPATRQESVTSGLNPVHSELLLSQSNLKNELAGLHAGVAAMERVRDEMRSHLATAPAMAAELRDLDRRYTVAQQAYALLLTKAAQANVSLSSVDEAMPSMRVVDYATTPSFKTWPKAKYLYPAALALGLILGVIAAWIKTSFGGRVSRLHFQQNRLSGPLYAILDLKALAMPSMQSLNERRLLAHLPSLPGNDRDDDRPLP
jgi:uncharacterized protein involved in exopolysaccharide biosynthesis